MGYDRGDSFPADFLNKMEFYLVRFSEQNEIPFGSQNLKENYHQDYIPFILKGNGNLVFSVHRRIELG